MPRLKAQLHVHSRQDPLDGIKHTEKQIIDHAARNRYDVLAISCHNVVIFNEDLRKYAESRRILLIPAIEKTIEKKHVLILNADLRAQNIKTFDDLKTYRETKPDILVIAPHPYYPGPTSLGKQLDLHIELFDALEYSWFHSVKLNRHNKKAVRAAEKYNLPLVGTSDNHLLRYFNHGYSLIDADRNIPSVFKAIKAKKVKVVSHGIKSYKLLPVFAEILIRGYIKSFTLK